MFARRGDTATPLTTLSQIPVARIVAAIADAAVRWSDADFPPRVRVLDSIVERTGYSRPVVEYALDRLFFSLRRLDIENTIASELGSPDALDRFVAQPGCPPTLALPVGRVCIISSRTSIGVAIVPAVFALCAKCDVLVKDREDALVSAFFASLAEELDELAQAARAQVWTGKSDSVDLTQFDAIVAFGDEPSLASIRVRANPLARFIPFGPKASVGYIAREALSGDAALLTIAQGAARDLVLYESEGCLSLHALFIERGGAVAPQEFAAMLAAEAERAAVEFPIGARDAGTQALVARLRDLAAFRAAAGSGAAFSSAAATHLVAFEPSIDEPPAFAPRTIGVHPVNGPADALAYVRRHRLPLEGLALAGKRPDLAVMAAGLGVARIAPFGELQHPALGDRHGGRPRIAEFVRLLTNDAR